MSLFSKAESFLKASGYDVEPLDEKGFLKTEQPDIGDTNIITCIGIDEKIPEESAQHLIVDRFDRVASQHPTASLIFLSPGTASYLSVVTDQLRHRKVSILPPALFFDTLFKYDTNFNAATAVKKLADEGKAQEKLGVKQPFRLASGERGDDITEYLLKEVRDQSRRRDSPPPTLWIVSAPAGYGKSYMFASLFRKVYNLFHHEKRLQREFPRPLPMIAEHLRSSAGPNIKGLINVFGQTEFVKHCPSTLFSWMIDNGHGFWMTDGLDEVIAGDDEFGDFLLDRLTHPAAVGLPRVILMSLRDSLLQSREQLQELLEIGDDVVRLIELLPWEAEQKHSFAWTKVYGKLPPSTKPRRSNAKLRSLFNTLTEDEHINKLSSTPFYADMIADEFLANSKALPANEFDWLDHAVGAMCQREYKKGGPIKRDVLPIEAFRAWLEEVAAGAVTQSGISIDELREYARLVLVVTKGGIPEREEERLVEQIMVMPFLKNSPVSGKFEFIHEILGEFLAGSFYAKMMQIPTPEVLNLDWVSRCLGHQALPGDSMLLKVIAWHFLEKRVELVEAINRCSSIAAPGIHRNIVQLLALMDEGRELLDNIGLSLEGTDLAGVQFGSMDLSEVSFCGSDLSFTDLSGCNLQNARFESTRLHDTFLPSQQSQRLNGAIFNSMKSFESIRPQGGRRIDSYDRFRDWTKVATQVEVGEDLPCPSARQLAALFSKFVHPNGLPRRRQWIPERSLLILKQIAEGPRIRDILNTVYEFGFLTQTRRDRRGASRPDMQDDRYGEIVRFMRDSALSQGLSELLSDLCQRPDCRHI